MIGTRREMLPALRPTSQHPEAAGLVAEVRCSAAAGHVEAAAPQPQHRQPAAPTPAELLTTLELEAGLCDAVPAVLELVARNPLASAGRFPGDLLRGLMEVPSMFWSWHPHFYDRYREALRAGAAARHRLPPEQRLDFWLGCSTRPRPEITLPVSHSHPGATSERE